MKHDLEAEKARLQEEFRLFNEQGATITIFEDDGERILKDQIDSLLVTRVAPCRDRSVSSDPMDFWLLWRPIGYQSGERFWHTAKIVRWSRPGGDDFAEIDLYDDQGRHYNVDLMEPNIEADLFALRCAWLDFKKEHPEQFVADEQMMAYHVEMAEHWHDFD